MTMVELILTIVVSALVLLGLSGLFAQGWRAQALTAEEDAAVGDAHVAAMQIEAMMRNTRKAIISADGTSLRAEVRVGGTWVCQTLTPAGTRFSPAGDTLDYGGRIRYDISFSGTMGSSVETSGAAILHGLGDGGATC